MRLGWAAGLYCVAIVAAGFWFSGCTVVDRARLDSLPQPGADGAVPKGNDADVVDGPKDGCGDDENVQVLVDSTADIVIDTRRMTNRVQECGGRPSPGADAFVAVDVVAGQYWHFHLRTDPTLVQDRDPFLYLLQAPSGGSCDNRMCNFNSDACTGGSDEHFAFVADASGRWYIGVDDRRPGGGVYLLDAFLPECGDGVRQHGESCDEPDPTVCDAQCRQIVSAQQPSEQEVNDNATEANFLRMPPTNELLVSGSIGGGTCTYPDYFAVQMPPLGGDLSVLVDGCTSGAETPFELLLLTPTGEVRVPPATDSAGCAALHSNPGGGPLGRLAEGLYSLVVRLPSAQEDRPVPYRLRIRITP